MQHFWSNPQYWGKKKKNETRKKHVHILYQCQFPSFNIVLCSFFKCNNEETWVKATQDLSEFFVTSRDYKFFQNKNQCKYVISQW